MIEDIDIRLLRAFVGLLCNIVIFQLGYMMGKGNR